MNRNYKLENRITRLERMINSKSMKNEDFGELSQVEIAKIDAIEAAAADVVKNAVKAVNDAILAVESCKNKLDDMDCVGQYDWGAVARSLDAANSYMPKRLRDYEGF
jgi:hypothetical protein